MDFCDFPGFGLDVRESTFVESTLDACRLFAVSEEDVCVCV